MKVCVSTFVFVLVCLTCFGKWTHYFENARCHRPGLTELNRRNSAPSPAHAPGARLTARAHFVAALRTCEA